MGAALQADGEYEVRGDGLKHQKEKRSMDHFAGLDVSVKETSVCIVDDTGRIIREVKVASEPEALLPVLTSDAYHFKRIGLEAGPLSQWLYSALAEAGLPVICVETRHDNKAIAIADLEDSANQYPGCLVPRPAPGVPTQNSESQRNHGVSLAFRVLSRDSLTRDVKTCS